MGSCQPHCVVSANVLQLQYVVCVNSSPYASSKDGTCGGGVVSAAPAAAVPAGGGGNAACGAIEVAIDGGGAEAGCARALITSVVSGSRVDCGFGDGVWEGVVLESTGTGFD